MMDAAFIWTIFLRLLGALQVTLSVWSLSVFIGAFIGAGVTWLRISGMRPLEWLARAYIFVFRGAPLLVQLDWSHSFAVEEGNDVTPPLSNRRLDSTRRPSDLE